MAVHPALLIALERASGSLALFVLLVGTGCGQVLGADEYGFAEPCPKGAARDSAGACVFRNECGPLEVPDLAEGTCVPVGVPAEQCGGVGFRSDDAGGCRAQVPQAECDPGMFTYPGVNGCVEPARGCNPTGFRPTTVIPAVYVSEGTGLGADGSQEKPYSTIAEGLAHLADGGAILLRGPGTYREDLVISTSDVEIIGCASSVTIEGTGNPTDDAYPCPVTIKDPADPANAGSAVKATVCVAPGTRGVKLRGLRIKGPGDGVFVAGATLELSDSGVESVGHYGIRVEETETPTGQKNSASLIANQVRVHQATGVGVYAAGASVDLKGVYIDRTRQPPAPFGGEARGVSVRPSGEIAVYTDNADAQATGPTRPKLKIRSSLISGNSEAGVWISGAESAEIETTFIGSLDPATPSGVGIVVEQSLPSGSPANATIRQCEIARASDAGIDVHNAKAVIEQTTIRDTWPRTSDGCSGQGIRVRQDPGEQADVTVQQSLIDQSRLSAVYVLNGSARVEQSILRGSAPRDVPEACAPAFGDGLTVESVGDQRAPVVLERSLVTETTRAAAYSAFSDLRINSSLLLSCSPHVVTGLGSIHAETALCGCGESLAACRIENAPLETWLARPGEGIWADNTMPFENCMLSGGVFIPMPGVRLWIADRPEIPATIAGEGGCFRLEGVPASGDLRVELWLHGWNAVAVDVTAPIFPGGFGGIELKRTQLEGLQGPTDLNRGMVLIIVPIPRDAGEIPKGTSLESNRGKVYYFGPSGGRDPKLKELSASGIAVMTNLEPGWLTLTLKPPVGTPCVLEKPIWGLRVPDQPLSLRTRVEPGVLSVLQFNCR